MQFENSKELKINFKELLRTYIKVSQHKSIYPVYFFTYQLKPRKKKY